MSLLYYLFIWILFCTGVAMLFIAIRVFFIEEEEYIYHTGQLRTIHENDLRLYECWDCQEWYEPEELQVYFWDSDSANWYCPKCKENRLWNQWLDAINSAIITGNVDILNYTIDDIDSAHGVIAYAETED